MTVLDQAIIKAYLRQGGHSISDEVESSQAGCLDVASREGARGVQLELNEPVGQQLPSPPASVPLDTIEITETSLPTKIAQAIERPGMGFIPAGIATFETRSASPESEEEPPSGAVTGSSHRVFKPMLRVDAISWPRPSRHLRRLASQQIERLADTVRKTAAMGGNLTGVAGFSHGEGCTTVLLAVALRLVELGQKTLLLDGDIAQPRLAEHLALANEMGWRDVAVGLIPLEDAVTQSDSECLALLPYCGHATSMDGPDPSEHAIATLLNQIRSHYDTILVDLGGALTSGGRGGTLAGRLASQIDSVLTVHNVQATSPSHLAKLRQHLRLLGVRQTGIIENFVVDGTS